SLESEEAAAMPTSIATEQNVHEDNKDGVTESYNDLLLELAPLPSDETFAEYWNKLQVRQAKNEFGSFLLRSLSVGRDEAIGMHRFGEWQHAATFLNAFYEE